MDDEKELKPGEGAEGKDGAEGGSEPQGGDKAEKKGKEEEPEAKYTDADVDAIVEKRLARERSKMEGELRKKLEDEEANKKSEAEKLKDMTELQRAQYEAKKVANERDELQSKLDLNEQTAIARKELASAGINLGDDLLAMFVSPDAEKTSAAIDQLKELWPKAVNEAVHQELKRTPPAADKTPGQKSFGAEFAEQYSNSKVKDGGKE